MFKYLLFSRVRTRFKNKIYDYSIINSFPQQKFEALLLLRKKDVNYLFFFNFLNCVLDTILSFI